VSYRIGERPWRSSSLPTPPALAQYYLLEDESSKQIFVKNQVQGNNAFFRYDVEKERQKTLHDKFCLASTLSNSFIANSQKSCVRGLYITIDEQLFSVYLRCKFIMCWKPWKIRIEVLYVDVETNTSTTCFISGKMRAGMPLSSYIRALWRSWCNCFVVTCDNFFTSLDFAHCQAKEKCSVAGKIRQNRKKLPHAAKRE